MCLVSVLAAASVPCDNRGNRSLLENNDEHHQFPPEQRKLVSTRGFVTLTYSGGYTLHLHSNLRISFKQGCDLMLFRAYWGNMYE